MLALRFSLFVAFLAFLTLFVDHSSARKCFKTNLKAFKEQNLVIELILIGNNRNKGAFVDARDAATSHKHAG
jgi:hypothetical protein